MKLEPISKRCLKHWFKMADEVHYDVLCQIDNMKLSESASY